MIRFFLLSKGEIFFSLRQNDFLTMTVLIVAKFSLLLASAATVGSLPPPFWPRKLLLVKLRPHESPRGVAPSSASEKNRVRDLPLFESEKKPDFRDGPFFKTQVARMVVANRQISEGFLNKQNAISLANPFSQFLSQSTTP